MVGVELTNTSQPSPPPPPPPPPAGSKIYYSSAIELSPLLPPQRRLLPANGADDHGVFRPAREAHGVESVAALQNGPLGRRKRSETRDLSVGQDNRRTRHAAPPRLVDRDGSIAACRRGRGSSRPAGALRPLGDRWAG